MEQFVIIKMLSRHEMGSPAESITLIFETERMIHFEEWLF
jgi:hypothetical protein